MANSPHAVARFVKWHYKHDRHLAQTSHAQEILNELNQSTETPYFNHSIYRHCTNYLDKIERWRGQHGSWRDALVANGNVVPFIPLPEQLQALRYLDPSQPGFPPLLERRFLEADLGWTRRARTISTEDPAALSTGDAAVIGTEKTRIITPGQGQHRCGQKEKGKRAILPAGFEIGETAKELSSRLGNKFGKMEAKLDTLEAKIIRMDTKVDNMEGKLDNLIKEVGALRDAIQDKTDVINKKIDALQWEALGKDIVAGLRQQPEEIQLMQQGRLSQPRLSFDDHQYANYVNFHDHAKDDLGIWDQYYS
ncbi:hypothetical protein VTI74DRAFT_4388 [Chaetomium olivicolor]